MWKKLTLLFMSSYLLVGCNSFLFNEVRIKSLIRQPERTGMTFVPEDSLRLVQHWCYFDSSMIFRFANRVGMINNETIKLKCYTPSDFTGFTMVAIINEKGYNISVQEWSCMYNHKYLTLHQHLKLDRSHYDLNDTLIADIEYYGIHLRPIGASDTLKIKGKIEVVLRKPDPDKKYYRW